MKTSKACSFIKITLCILHATGLAQLVERVAFNHKAVGSTPTFGMFFYRFHKLIKKQSSIVFVRQMYCFPKKLKSQCESNLLLPKGGCPSGYCSLRGADTEGGRLKICWSNPRGFKPHSTQMFFYKNLKSSKTL